jgi:hypothetical protein
MTTDTTTSSARPASASGDRLQDAASGLVDQAGRTAEAHASKTMTQAGDTLQHLAEAVRGAGSDIRAERPEFANVADTAANQVERAATYLRQHDAGEALEAATDFARRQPILVMGGALLAGLAMGRFLRSASDSQSWRYSGSGSSRLGAGTYAGMRSSYRDASYSGSTPYGTLNDRSQSGSTSFENRTSELEGTAAMSSRAGTSGSSSTGGRSATTGSGSGSRSSSSSSTSSGSKRSSSSRTSADKES